tara:strand:+ start:208 stop:543 length:336 start_codon:yes stop_codon:yes gene_type:complete
MATINIGNKNMGDNLNNLPSDQNPVSEEEYKIVDKMFKPKISAMNQILEKSKDIIVIGGLFLLFSLEQTDVYIKKYIRIANTSPTMLLIIKTCLFMLCIFIIKHLYLVKKN